MFCPNCGVKLEDGAAFCGMCGNSLAQVEAVAEETVAEEAVAEEAVAEEAIVEEAIVDEVVAQEPEKYADIIEIDEATEPVTDTEAFDTEDAEPEAAAELENAETEKVADENPKGKKKKGKKKIIAIILIILFLLFGGVGLLVLGVGALVAEDYLVTPQKTAESFATELTSGNSEAVYEMIFDDNSVVTYERFNDEFIVAEGPGLALFNGKSDYQLTIISENDTEIVYNLLTDDGSSLVFTVEKVAEGFFRLNKYRVVPSVCPSFEVYIPMDAVLYINDIRITDEPEYDKVTELNKYEITPLLTGEYIIKVEYMGNTYENRIFVYGEAMYNTITLGADELEAGSVIKFPEDYTTDDAEQFFNKMMEEYTFNSYEVVYYDTPFNLADNGIEAVAYNDYRVYAGRDYSSELDAVTDDATAGILISDIMTEEEYNNLIDNDNGYAVYKASEVQDRINTLWGAGSISLTSILSTSDIVTSKGFIIRDADNAQKGNFDYYGKIASSSYDKASGQFTIKAYVLKCDTEGGKVYDEGTGLQLVSGTVTRGAGVDFDAIVSALGINTNQMVPVEFGFGISNEGVVLLKANKDAVSKDVLDAQNVVVKRYQHTFYMKVKADGGLNMRYAPTEKAQVVKLIPNNSAIEITGYASTANGWVYANWGGFEGWVSFKYLTPNEYSAQIAGSEYWYTVDAGGDPLNMRKGDSTSEKRIGSIPDGSVVKFICYNADATWAYVIYDCRYAGWVSAEFINYAYSY